MEPKDFSELETDIYVDNEIDPQYEEFDIFSTDSEKLAKEVNVMPPNELKQVLAKTDVEMKRLGWSLEQGRTHLIKTYGKRSRLLLTKEELL